MAFQVMIAALRSVRGCKPITACMQELLTVHTANRIRLSGILYAG